jgi:phytoene dehydrogenase-like protein
MSTADALAAEGFSPTIIERFFRPLVGGIQLDPELGDSRRMFDIIFRMLSDGSSAVPSAGMQQIPQQLADRLPADTIQLNARVVSTTASSVQVEGADQIEAAAVVVATEGPMAASLLGLAEVRSKSVGCVYFTADEPPVDSKLIVLNGTGRGPVLNVAPMTNVAPTYAPEGRHLIAAAMPRETGEGIEVAAREQLTEWWGPQVADWEHVATYRIEHGQPGQATPFAPKRSVALEDGRFVCGDHRDTASIQGAMFSGRRCGELLAGTLVR